MVHAQASALLTPEPPGTTGALPPATRLDELEIERVLHDSGFGIVYLARDHALDLSVAVKEYLPATLAVRGAGNQLELREPSHGEAFERGRLAFINEARILARCDHASLLRVHRVWQANGTDYRVMPYYAGESLLAVRRGMREVPDETALRALLDALLGALQTLHEAGHAHGAVSPENILLLPDDRPVLMDFGAVRRAIISDRTRDLMAALEPGRPTHSAEAAQGTHSPADDLHALATVAQFCISGVWPAPTPAARDGAHAGLAGGMHALPDRAASQRFSKSLLDTLDAMRTARPNDARHAVARYRELLKTAPERVSSRVEPVMDPVPPAAAPSKPPEPEPPQVDREVDLSHAVAVAMRQAKNLHSSAPPRSAARSAATKQARFTPPPARLWSWGGAAVLGLAFGVAGWKLSEQIAAHTTAATLARAADQSTVVAAAPAGSTGERAVAAPADAPPAPAIEDVVARAPSASGRPQGAAADEARSAGAAREVATTSVAATAAAVTPTEHAAPSRRVVAQAPAPTALPPARVAGSPREECGARTNFALYRCMQMQCSQPRWSAHAQCVRLRATDEVG